MRWWVSAVARYEPFSPHLKMQAAGAAVQEECRDLGRGPGGPDRITASSIDGMK